MHCDRQRGMLVLGGLFVTSGFSRCLSKVHRVPWRLSVSYSVTIPAPVEHQAVKVYYALKLIAITPRGLRLYFRV